MGDEVLCEENASSAPCADSRSADRHFQFRSFRFRAWEPGAPVQAGLAACFCKATV